MSQKKQTKLIIRIVLLIGTIISLFFVPWIIVRAWLLPLPDTVQKQVNEALDYGFEGIIVYVDESGKPPAFYTAGWHDRDNKIPAKPNALFKIASIRKLDPSRKGFLAGPNQIVNSCESVNLRASILELATSGVVRIGNRTHATNQDTAFLILDIAPPLRWLKASVVSGRL